MKKNKTTPKVNLTLQLATRNLQQDLPESAFFKNCITATLANDVIASPPKISEITIRIVGNIESAALNKKYRKKNKPTNILSFNYDLDLPQKTKENSPLYGDLVICLPIVRKEAKQQGKSLASHLAHLTIHGTLHLLGYDHQTNKEAEAMETLEQKILDCLST